MWSSIEAFLIFHCALCQAVPKAGLLSFYLCTCLKLCIVVFFSFGFPQGYEDESFVPSLEDEAIEVEHLLAEPKNDNVSVDGVLSLKKYLDTEEIPGRLECRQESHSGNGL